MITGTEAAEKDQVFRIQNLELLDTLGLERRQGFRYSIDEMAPKLDAFYEQVRRARMTPAEERGLYEKKVLELDQRFNQYVMLREAFRPSPLRAESLSADLAQETSRRQQNADNVMPLAVPPPDPDGVWQPYSYAVFDALAQRMAANAGCTGRNNRIPATLALVSLLGSYGDKTSDTAAFNRNLQTYRTLLLQQPPSQWDPAEDRLRGQLQPLFAALLRDDALHAGLPVGDCFSGWDGGR